VVDRYTKVILTVIAVCLVALVGQNVIKPAYAQYTGPVHVIVDPIGASLASLPLPVRAQ
jgi:hypothetical protein